LRFELGSTLLRDPRAFARRVSLWLAVNNNNNNNNNTNNALECRRLWILV